jgi:hypothetical protein
MPGSRLPGRPASAAFCAAAILSSFLDARLALLVLLAPDAVRKSDDMAGTGQAARLNGGERAVKGEGEAQRRRRRKRR